MIPNGSQTKLKSAKSDLKDHLTKYRSPTKVTVLTKSRISNTNYSTVNIKNEGSLIG